ncbi:MAG: PKD domain-containing protein [Thermoplasmata archaeon]
MIDNIRERVAAILLTAILLFSATFVIPAVNVAAASETNNIEIPVLDNTLNVVTTATVKLTEVHTGTVITASYDSTISAYRAANAPSGYYRIDVTANGYYSFKDVTGFEFDGLGNYTRPSPIILTKFGETQYTYTVNVRNAVTGKPISSALVRFYDNAAKQEITSNITDATGQTNLKIFGGTALDLVVTATNYEMSVTDVGVISGDATVNVTLKASSVVSGFAYKQGGGIASNVVAYMYNIDQSLPWEKRVLRSTGSFVRFDAYPGTWIIVIDGSDVNPVVMNKTISGSELLTLSLLPQTQSVEYINLTFNSWNALDITTEAVWNADKTYLGLDFSDIGSLRAQVDLALGDADGIVSISEWSSFASLLTTHGPNYVTTSGLLHIDDVNPSNRTQYANRVVHSQYVDSFVGSVSSMANITYSSYASYETQVPLPADDDSYSIQMVVGYDSTSMSRVFRLDLVDGYELVHNTTLTSKVKVTGYENVTVDPLFSATSGSESITLSIEKSETPIVKAQIETGLYAYAKRNETNVLLYYVVKNDTAVTFSASGSSDPNGNPLTYIWDFGDSSTITTANVTCTHNYTVGAKNLTVSLTVRDVTMRTNTTTFILSVDSRLPRVKLNVYNMTMGPKTGSITIDQGDSLKFNPNGTIDDLKALNDGLGEVLYYEWTFGNETPVTVQASDTKNLTVTHKFDTAGDIKVVLNVTDLVGNWKNATVTIRVNDKTGPTVQLTKIMNGTWGTSLMERKIVYFDASKTTDNIDTLDQLNFTWDFGDNTAKVTGTGAAFANVSHTYSTYGKYDVVINVTDSSGNYATLTRTVYIGAGPRPNLEVLNITFDPDVFEEGVQGTITVWFVNSGSATAKSNITIEIWLYSGTEAQEKLGVITSFKNANGTAISQLEIEQEAYGIFQWTPDARGNYTIRAITNCTDQKQSNWKTATIGVNEAGWKKIALYVGIIVILIVIPLIILARRRIATMGGLRRERPEKEAKEKKKEKE